MRLFLKSILSAAFLIYSLGLHAESASDTLTHLLLNIHTMQSNFTQTVKDKSRKALQSATGNMSLQRPGKFRWEIKQPNPQLIIANGSRIWVYDPDLQQVTIRSFSKSTGQTPAFLLSDEDLSLGKDFKVEEVPSISQIASQKMFKLTPNDKENLFAHILLTFQKNDIAEMQLEDHLGHVTTIAFKQTKTGMSLPASLFEYTPSPKVDVIDETKARS
jgi:outer membrane lipoprotein carrier protein